MLKLYVASLSDYNAGIHHGIWIDCLNGYDACYDAISDMLYESPTAAKTGLPAEEWAIHADEGWEGIAIRESENLEALCELAEAIDEHGEAYADYVQWVGRKYATPEGFEDAYKGQYKDMEDYTYALVEECGYLDDMPEHLQRYFDYAAFARDLEIDGYHITDNGHVFCNN